MKNPTDNASSENQSGTPAALEDWSARAQEFVRDDPAKAVGYAALIGVLFTILPVGRLIALIIRLALGLVRPALLVLGGLKAYEEIEKRSHHSN